MLELGFGFLAGQWESDPELKPVQARTRAVQFRTSSFGMYDAASRGHPVDIARANGLFRSEAVAVDDLALDQSTAKACRGRPAALPYPHFAGSHRSL
jgi:hypothetical protein